MKIKSFDDWKSSVAAERRKLNEVRYYLNAQGSERLRVFSVLENLSDFCDTAGEMVAWIDSRERLDRWDIKAIESDHARPAIAALRRIVKTESVQG